MLFGRRGRRPKTGGSAVKDCRREGTGLHAAQRRKVGRQPEGSAAPILDGTGGNSTLQPSQPVSAARHPHQADRPQHQREIGASASLERGPKRQRSPRTRGRLWRGAPCLRPPLDPSVNPLANTLAQRLNELLMRTPKGAQSIGSAPRDRVARQSKIWHVT
jgi:hypothetical protein